MTDAWDERTEAIPGVKDDKSFDLGIDIAQDFADPEGADTAPQARPSVVVFEPAPLGLADALMRMGFKVRAGNTGVDVMSVVAAEQPGAVLCAPAPDAERRRLLAAALRLRFPLVPIIYVSTHAGQEDAVLGAIREGARAVLPWPLPAAAEVVRVLAPYLKKPTPSVVAPNGRRGSPRTETGPTPRVPEVVDEAVTGKSRLGPASEDEPFDEAATVVTPSLNPQAGARPSVPKSIGFADEPTTQPNLRPAALGVDEALAQKRGEIGELLAAVSPFLWSLEDAARWATELGQQGDSAAQTHARTLSLLAKILAQLQARIDDVGA